MQLGPERAALARELRRRLLAAGIGWPAWIDARPGQLQVILGDCSDPPLGGTAAALVQRHGELVLDGIAGLGLVTGVARLVLCASEPATVTGLRALCGESSVKVVETPAVYPACPEADVPAAGGHSYTVTAAELVRIGALVRGLPAPRLCTVAGAVAQPQVLERSAGTETAAALVRRCGGAGAQAWVAVVGGALGGVIWPADTPLPADTSLCLILPVTHELVARLRRGDQWLARARNACLSCRVCTDFCPVAQAGVPLVPHRLMREIAGVVNRAEEVATAALAATECTGCGACSVMCPAELLPGAAVRSLGAKVADRKAPSPLPSPVSDASGRGDSDYSDRFQQLGARRVPLALLLTRLGLDGYAPPA
jgi:ferredoxin